MMIELVMYGMIPSAKRLKRRERPPGEELEEGEHAALPGLSSIALTAFWSMPGTGM